MISGQWSYVSMSITSGNLCANTNTLLVKMFLEVMQTKAEEWKKCKEKQTMRNGPVISKQQLIWRKTKRFIHYVVYCVHETITITWSHLN